MENMDWKEADIRSIQVPVLIVAGDRNVPLAEHAVVMYRLYPGGVSPYSRPRMAVIWVRAMSPDSNSKIPELFVAMLDEFLKER